ncbi:hypothetical protein [Actinomadura sp. 9N407]|uniref:hypothetical protein n=1 Tax=Actinomadura sp. 9N407 TaxID=3375154 RepID=UPI00378D7C4B
MSDRKAIIAGEQRAVDHAYDCHERMFQENRERLGKPNETTDDRAGTSFITDASREVRFASDLGPEALVTMRVDVTEDDAEQTWYIGRRTVKDPASRRIVISWKAPLATEWMTRHPNDPGEVLLRRSLRCDGRVVKDYRDDIRVVADRSATDGFAEAAVSAPDPETAGTVIAGLRDFLLEDLERARDGRMRDIVETIQREQLLLVSDQRPGLLAVQGGPGTGKTAVGLHRISWLLFNQVFGAPDVLVVGPHQGFLDHVRDVLPQLGTDGVTMVELARLWDGARGADPLPARVVKSDGRMAGVLRRAVEGLDGRDALARQVKGEVFEFKFEGTKLSIPRAELESLRGMDDSAPYMARRQRFGNDLVDRLFRQFTENNRGWRNTVNPRRRLERHPRVVGLVGSVWPAISPEQVLRDLVTDPGTLRTAAADLLSEDEQKAMLRPRADRMADEPWSPEDRVCLEELRLLLSGEAPPRYRHVVIDEAQDLTPMQARSLARRCPGGSMTVLGDLAQATGVHRYGDWREVADLLAPQADLHLEELTVGYRVPHEVMEFAAPLAARVAPHTALPRSIRPAGEDAVSLVPVGSAALLDEASDRAERLDEARSVAVIVPDAMLEDARRTKLPNAIPAREAKGLEFDHVILVEPALIAAQEPAGLGQLYVAATRCTRSLTIVHSEPIPGEFTPGEPIPGESIPDESIPDESMPSREGEEATTMTESDATAPAEPFQAFISTLEEAVREERRCHVHEHVRHSLIAELYRAQLVPVADSPTADIVCDTERGRVLYEVLGEGAHTYRRMREAVLRLLEVQHAEGERADHTYIVLPQEPEEDWAAEMLYEAFGVSVIWRTADGWNGHRLPKALDEGR